MSVIAQRQPADKPGPSIVSSVLTTLESQLYRGATEINYSTPDKILETGLILGLEFVRPGKIGQVQSKGKEKNGKITDFSLSWAGIAISGNIVVEVCK